MEYVVKMSSPEGPRLDKNYKISKRKSNEIVTQNSNSVDNSYDNYRQDRWQRGTVHQMNPNSIEPITQNIYNTLHTIKEKPKIYQKNVFKEIVPDVSDQTLPKELTVMFQPLFCKLCTAQLSSNVMAKLHYKSKNHEKKIRKYLNEYSERTGEPLHKRARLTGTPKCDEEHNPKWFHCDICDLPLTGKMHAESHYMGRNHHKALMGYKQPAGRGFYNAEGKWVRTIAKKKILDVSNDTFGEGFRPKELAPTATCQPIPPPAPPIVSAPSTSVAADSQQQRFHCSICDVAATCQEQIDMHFKGQKHAKKLKQLGLGVNCTLGDITTSDDEKSKTVSIDKVSDVNLSVYRTPSGDFYCQTCNLTLNSEPQFKTHLNSKGHMKKVSQK